MASAKDIKIALKECKSDLQKLIVLRAFGSDPVAMQHTTRLLTAVKNEALGIKEGSSEKYNDYIEELTASDGLNQAAQVAHHAGHEFLTAGKHEIAADYLIRSAQLYVAGRDHKEAREVIGSATPHFRDHASIQKRLIEEAQKISRE
jgi:hypothetical protein